MVAAWEALKVWEADKKLVEELVVENNSSIVGREGKGVGLDGVVYGLYLFWVLFIRIEGM